MRFEHDIALHKWDDGCGHAKEYVQRALGLRVRAAQARHVPVRAHELALMALGSSVIVD